MFTKRVQRHDSQQMNYKVGETSLCRPWPAGVNFLLHPPLVCRVCDFITCFLSVTYLYLWRNACNMATTPCKGLGEVFVSGRSRPCVTFCWLSTTLCLPVAVAVLLICASFSRRKTYNSTATSTPYSQRGTHCLCFARIVVHRFALCAVLWLIFVYKGPCSVACRISVGNFHPPKGSAKCTQLSPGFHSLANDVTPDSDWPKERVCLSRIGPHVCDCSTTSFLLFLSSETEAGIAGGTLVG